MISSEKAIAIAWSAVIRSPLSQVQQVHQESFCLSKGDCSALIRVCAAAVNKSLHPT